MWRSDDAGGWKSRSAYMKHSFLKGCVTVMPRRWFPVWIWCSCHWSMHSTALHGELEFLSGNAAHCCPFPSRDAGAQSRKLVMGFDDEVVHACELWWQGAWIIFPVELRASHLVVMLFLYKVYLFSSSFLHCVVQFRIEALFFWYLVVTFSWHLHRGRHLQMISLNIWPIVYSRVCATQLETSRCSLSLYEATFVKRGFDRKHRMSAVVCDMDNSRIPVTCS